MEKPYCPYECLCQVWCKSTKKEDLPCYDPYFDSEDYKEWVEHESNKEDDYLPW